MAEYDKEYLLSKMLSEVPNSLDKREGSVIYNTLAPVAASLASAYFMFAYMNDLLFSDTAEGDWLTRVTADFGIDREAATYAVRQINTYDGDGNDFDVPIGSRFALNDITLKITEKIAAGQFKATCEQLGTVGNQYGGTILPVDNINGLGSAELVSAPLITARDEETDDELRARFYSAVRQVAFGGNIADYEQKVSAIDGVGAVKVFGAPDLSAGQVGLIIGDEQGGTASQTLIDTVQALMGTDGNGIAPIGHTVTVGTSAEFPVNVEASVILKTGTSFEAIHPYVVQAVQNYIENIGFNAGTIFWAKLVAEILNCNENIMDVETVTINGVSANITLVKTFSNYQVPVVGTITVTEAV